MKSKRFNSFERMISVAAVSLMISACGSGSGNDSDNATELAPSEAVTSVSTPLSEEAATPEPEQNASPSSTPTIVVPEPTPSPPLENEQSSSELPRQSNQPNTIVDLVIEGELTYLTASIDHPEFPSHTLYTFDRDDLNESHCAEECLTTWLPFTISSVAELISPVNVSLGAINHSTAGELHVSVNGKPLYFYREDLFPNDTNGRNIEDWKISNPIPEVVEPESQTGPVVDPQDTTLVVSRRTNQFGTYIISSDLHPQRPRTALYTFDSDNINESNCFDLCYRAWPPLTVDSNDDLAAPEGINLGTFVRSDTGETQVTLNGLPLYFFINDIVEEDTKGARFFDWQIAKPDPDEPRITEQVDTTLVVSRTNDQGTYLISSDFYPERPRLSLYTYEQDESNQSNCFDQCLRAWPPFVVDSVDDLISPEGLDLGTFIRSDTGQIQVSLNGMPLYFFVNDFYEGQVEGTVIGWTLAYTMLVPPPTVTAPVTDPNDTNIVVKTTDEALGTYLFASHLHPVRPKFTLYTLTDDSPNKTVCFEGCARIWPPLTIDHIDELKAPQDVALGIIVRSDTQQIQVTLDGFPLYFYKGDNYPGETLGNGLVGWVVASPNE